MNQIERKIFLILLLLLVNTKSIYSQVNQEWSAFYNYNNGDGGFRFISIDNSGSIIVAGGIASNSGDYLTIKYNSSGVQQWISTYNGAANDKDSPFAITVDDLNNIYVTGWSKGIGTNYDFATIKYNSSGVQQWVARYNGTGNLEDLAYAIAVDSLYNVYVTGQTLSDTITLGNDMITIKYNLAGVQQWVKTYHGSRYRGWDCSKSVTIDRSNNIYITGFSSDSVTGQSFATIKYDQNGIQQWVANYNGANPGIDEARFIKVDENSNVYVSGYSEGAMRYDDYATVKYNSQGVEQWARKYDGSAHFIDHIWGMAIDNLGNVYVTGYSTETGTGYDYTTIKYNSIGEQIWLRRYNNGLNDIPQDIKIDNLGNIYITGQSDGSGTDDDFATIKYDSSGNQKWVIRYNYAGQSVDESRAIALDILGNVYVTGYSNRDFLTIKYSQLTGVNPVISELQTEFKLHQNYPNPFNPNTIINYQLSMVSNVNLKVYNVLGNEVRTVVNKKQNAGSYEVEFDGEGLPSGIYFYSLLIDGNIIDTKRMILLK